MADRVLLGKNTNTGNVGLWVSKPGANVIHLAGNSYMESLENWYGYQKEFDDSPETAWTAPGTTVSTADWVYDPGGPSDKTKSWFFRAAAAGVQKPQVKRSKDNTLLISPTGTDFIMYTEQHIGSATGRSWVPTEKAFTGSEHTIVEMRIRLNLNAPTPPISHNNDFLLYAMSGPVRGAVSSGGRIPDDSGNLYTHPYFWARVQRTPTLHQDPNDSGYQFEHSTDIHVDAYNTDGIRHADSGVEDPDGVPHGYKFATHCDGAPITSRKYDALLGDGDWHIIEWDMSNDKVWTDHYGFMQEWSAVVDAYNNNETSPITGLPMRGANPVIPAMWEPHLGDEKRPYSSEYRILRLRIDPNNNVWNPSFADPANPDWLFEIDYLRVKKKGVPNDVGKYGSVRNSLVFSSDWQETGLVHQEGTVTIGTQKANIDGTTSLFSFNRVNYTSTLSDGVITFPKLPYIPVVLFQRYDAAAAGGTANSYPGGEQEFSIATTKWEDHNYPTWSASPKQFYPGWDIDLKTADGTVAQPWWGMAGSLTSSLNPTIQITDYSHYDLYADGGTEVFPSAPEALPWNDTPIPAPSTRAGNTFSSDYAYYFSEMRTFAYARAGKDHFSLTCRNAIAQEGLEHAWNLSPTLPEAATANQGFAAYDSSEMKNTAGNWGMFHPALILFDNYDGAGVKPFSEGLKLNAWADSSANTMLIDLEGTEDGTDYPQFKWWLNYSGYPFVYDGSLARPSDPIPTDKTAYATGPGEYPGDTGGFYPHRYEKGYASAPGAALSMRQYRVKRLSSPGIFHPEGVVPKSSPAFNNRNAADNLSDGSSISNHTSYIGGSWNEVTGSGTTVAFNPATAKPPTYKYWVLRIPASIKGYTPNDES